MKATMIAICAFLSFFIIGCSDSPGDGYAGYVYRLNTDGSDFYVSKSNIIRDEIHRFCDSMSNPEVLLKDYNTLTVECNVSALGYSGNGGKLSRSSSSISDNHKTMRAIFDDPLLGRFVLDDFDLDYDFELLADTDFAPLSSDAKYVTYQFPIVSVPQFNAQGAYDDSTYIGSYSYGGISSRSDLNDCINEAIQYGDLFPSYYGEFVLDNQNAVFYPYTCWRGSLSGCESSETITYQKFNDHISINSTQNGTVYISLINGNLLSFSFPFVGDTIKVAFLNEAAVRELAERWKNIKN